MKNNNNNNNNNNNKEWKTRLLNYIKFIFKPT